MPAVRRIRPDFEAEYKAIQRKHNFAIGVVITGSLIFNAILILKEIM